MQKKFISKQFIQTNGKDSKQNDGHGNDIEEGLSSNELIDYNLTNTKSQYSKSFTVFNKNNKSVKFESTIDHQKSDLVIKKKDLQEISNHFADDKMA